MSSEEPVTERIGLRALVDGTPVAWTATVDHHEDAWRLKIESSSAVEWEGEGADLFEALRQARGCLEPKGVRLCCNGARIDTWPSRMAREHGAWVVYVHRRWLPTTVRDLVPVLGAADAGRIGTVAEQDDYHAWHLANRKRWFNLVNPLWWIWLFTSSWGRPKGG
ncbi:hypothetical protein [Streptomyces phytophilus]|uniref:hypothetical protein n=1 Tax=Streptomyces phytophilus TaxID=722715 RepID=UPI0015F124F5|nr:hypothetical protein [Streptomyces phytophilus]